MSEYSTEFMEWVIDRVMPFHILLHSGACIHSDYRYFPKDEGTCFCPFHDNENTKAAKLYSSQDGQTIYCFAEQRLYKPHHLISKGIVEVQMEKVFNGIWKQFNENTRASLISSSNVWSNSIPPLKDYSRLYESYRNGEMSLGAVCMGMLETSAFPYKTK